MLGNFIKETSATTGTGTVSLSAVTGFSRFSDQFAVGRSVAYAIEDGGNRETGIGTIGAANTLERTVVLSKLQSGVYSESPETGLSLSGNATVFIAPDRSALFGGFGGVATDAELYSGHVVLSATPSRSQADPLGEYAYLTPFLLLGRAKIKALSANCSAADAGAISRFGLYSTGKDGRPDRLIVQTGDVDASSTGAKVASVAQTVLAPGWYYTCLANRSGYPSYYAYATTQNRLTTPLGGVMRYAYEDILGWAVLPDKIVSPTLSAGANGDFAVSLVGG